MAKSVNKVFLMGYVGGDPEVNAVDSSGILRVNFSIATNRRKMNKQTGEVEELTDWHSCTAFGRTAELIRDIVKKGDLIHIEGEIQYYKLMDNINNIAKWITSIVLRDFSIAKSKNPPKLNAATVVTTIAAAAPKPDGDDDLPF